jgi:L-seryl-tRNA(Ser) seleniumtransferase
MESESSALRALPSVDMLLHTETARRLKAAVGARHLAALARDVTDLLRAEIREQTASSQSRSADSRYSREALLEEAARRLEVAWRREAASGVRRVINASGVILHTNLGRAPLSDAARQTVANEAAGYCTLEYDLETGARGARGVRVEQLLCELTGAESALVVNNCAAAAVLILTVLAHEGETIVSRGELVEIGGDFRVPDVMASSGTRMVEVGTTNRTHLADYRKAINESTRLVMRVHTSNYRIVGFTSSPELRELAELAHEAGLPLYNDAGSGALIDLSEQGLTSEPVIGQAIAAGADVVSFSGDKLLGGPQAGLIVGRRRIVEQLRKHPLYRALRADKLALAALEATLDAHRRGASFSEVPALRMIAASYDQIKARAHALAARLRETISLVGSCIEIVDGESAVGGGSAPLTHPRTALIALSHARMRAEELEQALRRCRPPVIARVAEGQVLLDLRTVDPREEDELEAALAQVLQEPG